MKNLTSLLTSYCPIQGLQEGGQEETMTPGPIMGPVGFRGPRRGPIEMTLRNQNVEDRRPFFFLEITSKSGQNCGIFPVCCGVQKTGDA